MDIPISSQNSAADTDIIELQIAVNAFWLRGNHVPGSMAGFSSDLWETTMFEYECGITNRGSKKRAIC